MALNSTSASENPSTDRFGFLERKLSRRRALKLGAAGAAVSVGTLWISPKIQTVRANGVSSTPTGGGFQGCSIGYWKTHTSTWASTPYSTFTRFDSVFAVPAAYLSSLFGKTLLDAIWQGGGQEKALGRQAVCAILNATHPQVNYPLSLGSIISQVNAALAAGVTQIEALESTLEGYNNLHDSVICPD